MSKTKACDCCDRSGVEFYSNHSTCKACLGWWIDGGLTDTAEIKEQVLTYGSFDNYLQHQAKSKSVEE